MSLVLILPDPLPDTVHEPLVIPGPHDLIGGETLVDHVEEDLIGGAVIDTELLLVGLTRP